MNKLQQQLLDATKTYIDAKKNLEGIERQYNALYARLYLQEKILGMKTEEMRKNEMILIMENEYKAILDQLYDVRGKAREAYYWHEAIVILLNGTGGNHEV
jgi:hypothetical protein